MIDVNADFIGKWENKHCSASYAVDLNIDSNGSGSYRNTTCGSKECEKRANGKAKIKNSNFYIGSFKFTIIQKPFPFDTILFNVCLSNSVQTHEKLVIQENGYLISTTSLVPLMGRNNNGKIFTLYKVK